MKKKASESYTEQVQLLTKASMNGYNRLFGGILMEWIDVVAAIAARRHSGKNVTTAVVDRLEFRAPAHTNECLVLRAKVTYAGKTSMEVCVKTYIEGLNGERELINKAYLVMVALDENEQPTEVPELVLETEAEIREWEAAKRRNKLRKKRRMENY